jgi:signal transduction histidine kinase/HPt (histidine-containing phosphotransfer) domain-containing protein/ActR/RegA family two-component response regulator
LKPAAWCSALLALLILAAVPTRAGQVVTDLSEPVSIAGEWRFQVGDDPAWSAADFDDSDWHSTTVPASAPAGHTGYGGMLWYRLALELDVSQPSVSQQLGALAVVIGDVQSAYEVFAGGIRLGGVGEMPPRPQAVYDRRQTWSIPPEAVSDDGKLVLALRVWRDPERPASWDTGPYGGEFLLGNVGELRAHMLRKALIPSLVLAALYLVLGLYHLLIARRNPALKEFFWFGLLSIALAGYTFETSQSKFFVDVPYLWHKKLEFLLLYISPFLLSKTLLTATRTPDNRVLQGFNLIFIGYFIVALVVPGGGILAATLTSFQYLGAVWAVSMASIMGWRAYKGSRSARGVVALMLILAAAVVNDVILETAVIGSGNVLYLVYALILLFIALMMAERYTEILKQLEMSVEERTEQLVEANRELESALETKGQFLATMSHEMRTPMNAVLGLTRLGLKTDLSGQQRDYFSKVEQSAEDLQDIIESVLDFSRLEEGELSCVSEPFSLRAMVEGLQRTWGDTAEQAGLEFLITVDPAVPGSLVGDGKRLKQVLGNLLSNAVKFTERGQVALSIGLAGTDNDVASVNFKVVDTGVGISVEQREHLFEAFSQADGTMTRQYGGTGLGLSVAQRLVELMGGRIEVDSAPGEGSTFHFDLDLPVSHTTPEVEEAPDEIDLSPIRGARILLVDDSDLNLQVAGELLRQAQLYVDVAHDGSEAVDKVFSGPYDCVLMDVQMPVMDGYEATERIRASEDFRELPIIAMTANAMPQDRARGMEAGMNDYVPKPIDPGALHAALLKWVEPGDRHYEEDSPGYDGESAVELPGELPGIAVAAGLNRVGGNVKLYLQLLSDLCEDYRDAPQRLRAMLQSGDPEEARQLAHKLRGIANNLGAQEVGASAEAIESSLKGGDPVTDDALGDLDAAMALTIQSRETLSPQVEAGSGATQMSDAERRAMLDDLMKAIADNNPEALEMVEQLLAGSGEEDEGREFLVAAKDALDIYDFAGALEHLKQL